MLGQAHTPRRRFWPLAAIALAVLVAPAVGGANPTHSVSSLRAQDAAIAARSRSAVLGLYSLDQRLAGADAQLATLRREATSLRSARATLRLQIRVARHSTAAAERELAQRIRALYEQGNVEPLEILFGSSSLDEALTSLDNLSMASAQGEDALVELKAARTRLTTEAHALATRESALAAATREAEATAAALRSARSERSAYIASLAAKRRLTGREIGAVVARAHAAQLRTASIARSAAAATPAASPAPPPEAVASAPVPAGRALTVTATGYALGGTTSTGLPVGWGIAAVDPSVIPLGTHLTVPGYGEAVAADTGGGVGGATIDLWFPTVAQANAWGRRTLTIILH